MQPEPGGGEVQRRGDSDLISKRTIFSLLLTLLGVGVIFAWNVNRRDECSAYLAGQPRAPHEAVVMTGSRRVLVPCDQWFLRQPEEVQVGCLGVVAGVMVFAVSAVADWQRRGERRR